MARGFGWLSEWTIQTSQHLHCKFHHKEAMVLVAWSWIEGQFQLFFLAIWRLILEELKSRVGADSRFLIGGALGWWFPSSFIPSVEKSILILVMENDLCFCNLEFFKLESLDLGISGGRRWLVLDRLWHPVSCSRNPLHALWPFLHSLQHLLIINIFSWSHARMELSSSFCIFWNSRFKRRSSNEFLLLTSPQISCWKYFAVALRFASFIPLRFECLNLQSQSTAPCLTTNERKAYLLYCFIKRKVQRSNDKGTGNTKAIDDISDVI